MATKKTRTQKVGRSSKTGKFVTKKKIKSAPATTYTDSVLIPVKNKKKKVK